MSAVIQQRRGRGKAQSTMELIRACQEILAEIQPASVRAVCYRLFTMGLIPNMSKGSTNKVSTQLVWARESNLIPWEWIVDETREVERISAWSDTNAIINAAVKGYRRDYWQDQPCRVEVWSEKGTVRGTLAPVLNELGVAFRVMHGFASATAVNDIAEMSNESDKPMVALYVGDFDPSGRYMSDVDLPGRVDRYGGDLQIERIALLEGDTVGLPSFPAESKIGDARFRWYVRQFGRECWELDAMSPVLLRERVREQINSYIEPLAWSHAIGIERVEVASMREFQTQWTNTMKTGGRS